MNSFSKYMLIGCACFLASPAHAVVNAPYSADLPQHSIKLDIASEKTVTGAQNFIDNMTKRGIDFLGDAGMTKEEQKKEFRKLLDDSFDMRKIGQFALGRYWRSATDAQKREYQKLFKVMVLNVYAERFSEYRGQTLEVTGARAEGKSDVIVSSVIKNGSPEVGVDWRVRYKGGKYKVIDVIVAGVSMGLTQRSDFASVIQRGGGDVQVLIDHLKKHQ